VLSLTLASIPPSSLAKASMLVSRHPFSSRSSLAKHTTARQGFVKCASYVPFLHIGRRPVFGLQGSLTGCCRSLCTPS
jgi:hypothetical protein